MSRHGEAEQNLDSQYRRPSGEVGRRIGLEMARDHLPENMWTVAQLNPQPTDHILEIGFGPGIAIEKLLKRVTTGIVAGVDFSHLMVSEASLRNREAIEAGRADLRYGEASELPYPDACFDKAFTIHSIYFWSQPMAALSELYRVLKPTGLMVIIMLPKDRWPPNPQGSALEFGTPECTPYFGSEVEQMLAEAGFSRTWIEIDETSAPGSNNSNYSVLGLK